MKRHFKRPRILASLGPGLVTGAADDDPSGIATYSQAGAAYGFNLMWVVVLAWPFLTAFQFTCAKIARVTARGLAANLCSTLPRPLVLLLMLMLLVANTVNIAADLAAMAAATQLVAGGQPRALIIGFAALSLLLQVFVPYHRYAGLLKWLTLSLFAYVGVVIITGLPWAQVLRGIVAPDIRADAATATTITAVLGTTISPYLFFWQSSQELEEMARRHDRPLTRPTRAAKGALAALGLDSLFGFALTMTVSLCIIAATAVTLHAGGATGIATAADAANALRPVAGDFAFALFAVGIIGTGLLAVPVLAGSAAYALSETMGWRTGLELKPGEAIGFYALIAAAVTAAVGLDLLGVDPIKALFWAAVVNGVVAVPIMAAVMWLAGRRTVMGSFAAGGWQKVAGWGAVALMAVAAGGMLLAG